MKKGKFTKPKMRIASVYHLKQGMKSWEIATEEMWKNEETFPVLSEMDEKGEFDMEFDLESDALIVNYRIKDAKGKTNQIFAFAWEQGY